MWLAIEVGIVGSCIYGGIFYSFMFKLKHPYITFKSPRLDEGFGDFMESNAFAIDMTNNIMAPALISIWMSVEKLKENGLLLHISAALCLAQLLLLYVGLFLTRGSVNRSSVYISIIPDLTYWASVVSFTVMPLLIIGINIAASIIITDAKKYVPFLIFVILI